MIQSLIDNYNNYSKKVIHNIISNILNKEDIADYENNTIYTILDTILSNILNSEIGDKDLLYIDTILFIIDKLFLYGSINNDNKKDILNYIKNDIIPNTIDYMCFSTIINYITFYETSFQKSSNNGINVSESATGTFTKKIKLDDFKINQLFIINLENISNQNTKNELIKNLVEKYNFNSNKITKKINNMNNFTVQLLGCYYDNIINTSLPNIYFVFFENILNIIVLFNLSQIKELINKKLIIKNTNKILEKNIFNIDKFEIEKFQKLQKNNFKLSIEDKNIYINGQPLLSYDDLLIKIKKEHDNNNKTLIQSNSTVNPTSNLKIENIIKGDILKLDKNILLNGSNVHNFIKSFTNNNTLQEKYIKKIIPIKNFLFEVLGYYKPNNTQYIVLFENYTKVIIQYNVDNIKKYINNIQLIKKNNINSKNIFEIKKVQNGLLMKNRLLKSDDSSKNYILKYRGKEYKLTDTLQT
jgi:hypothetical protein